MSLHFYQDSNDWQEIDYKLIDGNTAEIEMADGGVGDFSYQKDGIIDSIITISYPDKLDVHIEEGNCFIGLCEWRKDNEMH